MKRKVNYLIGMFNEAKGSDKHILQQRLNNSFWKSVRIRMVAPTSSYVMWLSDRLRICASALKLRSLAADECGVANSMYVTPERLEGFPVLQGQNFTISMSLSNSFVDREWMWATNLTLIILTIETKYKQEDKRIRYIGRLWSQLRRRETSGLDVPASCKYTLDCSLFFANNRQSNLNREITSPSALARSKWMLSISSRIDHGSTNPCIIPHHFLSALCMTPLNLLVRMFRT